MHAGHHARDLAKAAQACGAHVLEHTSLLGVQRQTPGLHVVRTRGEKHAAAGACGERNLANVTVRLDPARDCSVRGFDHRHRAFVAETARPDAADRPDGDRHHNFVNFFRVTPDNRSIGGRERSQRRTRARMIGACGTGADVGTSLTPSPRVEMVSMTGSTRLASISAGAGST